MEFEKQLSPEPSYRRLAINYFGLKAQVLHSPSEDLGFSSRFIELL